jgi:hypothetical protein
MPHEIEPREGGAITLTVGDFSEESTVTGWDPPNRFAAKGAEAPDGTVQAFEYLIEGRDNGTTVLRFVHSGLLGDDWGNEYEVMAGFGWDMYLHTLGQYLTYFPGRAAVAYVSAESPQWTEEGHVVLARALGLTGELTEGEQVRLTPAGLPPIEGVADYPHLPYMLGIRTADALYRFHLRPNGVGVGHHVFSPDVDQKEANHLWHSWLSQLST